MTRLEKAFYYKDRDRNIRHYRGWYMIASLHINPGEPPIKCCEMCQEYFLSSYDLAILWEELNEV